VPADLEKIKDLYRAKRFEDLLRLLETELAADPSDFELLIWASRCALALRLPGRAESFAIRATETDPENPDGFLYLARARMALEEWDAALKTAEQALEAHPGEVEFRFIAGRALLQNLQFEDALRHLLPFVKARPGHVQGLKNAGEAALKSADFAAAENIYARLAPADPETALKAFQTLREKNQTAGAAAVLQAVLRHHPANERAVTLSAAIVRELVLRATMAEQAKLPAQAVRFLALILKFEPENRDVAKQLKTITRDIRQAARAAQAEGDLKGALEKLEALNAVRNEMPIVSFEVAQIKQALKAADAAEAWVEASQVAAIDQSRILTMAERLNTHKCLADAARVFLRASPDIAQSGNGQRVKTKIVVALQHALTSSLKASDLDSLQSAVMALAQLDPQNPAASKFRAKAITLRMRELRKARLDDDDDALEYAASALLELDPENISALHYLGRLMARSGRWLEALPLARKLAGIRPDDVQSQRNLARICYSARLREEGLNACQNGLSINPEDEQLKLLSTRLSVLPAGIAV
jgi:tetratricopeptide (TPR) repeat protein